VSLAATVELRVPVLDSPPYFQLEAAFDRKLQRRLLFYRAADSWAFRRPIDQDWFAEDFIKGNRLKLPKATIRAVIEIVTNDKKLASVYAALLSLKGESELLLPFVSGGKRECRKSKALATSGHSPEWCR
jgi:hypothetical protein